MLNLEKRWLWEHVAVFNYLYDHIVEDGEGNGNPLQYSCQESPMDRELGGLQSMGSLRVGHD